jgi:putative ubiquitin-RnfH superfamily antitoxin RatB of RatAB toxin-antitoxin module
MKFRVLVVAARADAVHQVSLEVAAGATVAEAVRASGGVEARTPIEDWAVGIFGERCSPDTRLRAGDRVEIYRPLQIGPREARRLRARR